MLQPQNNHYQLIMKNLKFTKNHEWVRLEKNNIAAIGITDRIQYILGDIIAVKQPEKGITLLAGQECAVIESAQTYSDVVCPISGEVSDINDNVTNFPYLLNQKPESEGWLFKIRLSKKLNLEDLLTFAEYRKHLSDTAH